MGGRSSSFRAALATLAVLAGPGAGAAAADLKFITVGVAPWASFDPAAAAGPESPVGAVGAARAVGAVEAVGVFPEVVHELERRTGNRIAIELQPFVRIDHELESGQQDCTIIVWSDRRSRFVERGEALFPYNVGVIGRRGLSLTGAQDLHGLTVSVLRGLTLSPEFDHDPLITKDFDTDYEQALRKLQRGRVDAVIGALPTLRHLAHNGGLDDLLGDQLVLWRPPMTLQCAKLSPHLDLLPDLNRAIREMRDDGTLDRIRAAHYFL